MPLPTPHPTGLKPTLATLLILVAWAALSSFCFSLFFRSVYYLSFVLTIYAAIAYVSAFAIAGPGMVLGAVLLLLGWGNPRRMWYGTLIQATSAIAFGLISLTGEILRLSTGQPSPYSTQLTLVGVVCPLVGLFLLASEWPRVCPVCGRRSVVTALPRSAGHPQVWCARCGRTFDRGKG